MPLIFKLTGTVFCVVLLLVQQTFAFYLTGTYQSSGTEIEAPVFITENGTWQILFHLQAEPGSMIVPLFQNRTSTPDNYKLCQGYVQLSCLYAINNVLINEEFDAYLHYIITDSSALDTLPLTTSLFIHAFPLQYNHYPRAWCLSNTNCVLEIPDEMLSLPWLSKDLGKSPTLYGVIDREIEILFAFVKIIKLPLIQVTLINHKLIFHDPIGNGKTASNIRHHAFHILCSDKPKPENAMWRADLNKTCLWFCMPGTIMYPSATDYFHMSIEAAHDHTCDKEPANVVIMQFSLSLDIPSTSNTDVTHANALLFLQETVTRDTGVKPRESIFYLQKYSSTTMQQSINVFVPYDRLYISVALFVRSCDSPNNFTTQVLNTKNAIENVSTSFAADFGYSDINVLDYETFSKCPIKEQDFPVAYVTGVGLWAFGVCALSVLACEHLLHGNERRHKRVLSRMGPLVRH